MKTNRSFSCNTLQNYMTESISLYPRVFSSCRFIIFWVWCLWVQACLQGDSCRRWLPAQKIGKEIFYSLLTGSCYKTIICATPAAGCYASCSSDKFLSCFKTSVILHTERLKTHCVWGWFWCFAENTGSIDDHFVLLWAVVSAVTSCWHCDRKHGSWQ